MNADWRVRLRENLEPVLAREDPRSEISAYHDMPCAIFQYPPDDEFELRHEVSLLQARLEQRGKRVTTVSLADCLWQAVEEAGVSIERLSMAEKQTGVGKAVETVVAKRRKAAAKGAGEDKKANVNAAVKMHSGKTLDES